MLLRYTRSPIKKSPISILKFICCLKEEKSTDKTIVPKGKRKVNLDDATRSGSNSEVVLDAEFKKIVKELKKTQFSDPPNLSQLIIYLAPQNRELQ